MDAPSWTIEEGHADRLGAYSDGQGVNFAIFSANGEKVELCLFDPTGEKELTRLTLPGRTGDIWHGYVPGLKPGQVYGYRVHGPYDPAHGHFFNSHKLVLDPYARELAGTFRWSDTHYGYVRGKPGDNSVMDTRDNAADMVKARVLPPWPQQGMAPRPTTPRADTIVYEAHIKGLTQKFPGLAEKLRGTAEGFGSPEVIAHLKSLGVTTVELLPPHAHIDERRLHDLGLKNYWGYNTLAFFAPEPSLLASGQAAEFRKMVDDLHKAGIEVILDVVYNHTCEGDERSAQDDRIMETGPTFSLRGIDSASYYRFKPDEKGHFVDYTGCGNTLNMDHPQVQRMVLDSLRYWVQEMHVDGFRFDLAVTLGRHGQMFSPQSPFFQAIKTDPVLSRVKLIAEPWDLGPEGYQVGNFPSLWAEWNDKFRDEMRAFWRGDRGMIGRLADRLSGSRSIFGNKSNAPFVSINAIANHDGMPLNDLVTYERKHNEANLEENRDGNDNNVSCNYGAEGETDDPVINAVRQQQKLNMMTSLLLSQGTPMILAGDEFGNSQRGNNNAYCQDNETGWLDWDKIDRNDRQLMEFTRELIKLRKENPVLHSAEFLNGFNRCAHGVRDIKWFMPEGHTPSIGDWNDPGRRCLGVMLNNGAVKAPAGVPEDEKKQSRLMCIFNAHSHAIDFTLPVLRGGETGWRRLLDTAQPSLKPGDDPTPLPQGSKVTMKPRSIMILGQDPVPAPPPIP